MKKTLKGLLVAIFMLVILLALTGCGDKLVATRETEEAGMSFEEKIEVSFKDDKVNKVKRIYTFDDKEIAEAMSGVLKMGVASEEMNVDVKRSGKKVTMTLDAAAYAEMANEDEMNMNKEELREMLEEQGYTVK